MLPVIKEVESSIGKIKLYDLTFGFITRVEAKEELSKAEFIENGSNLDIESIYKLRRNEVETFYNEILKLTYPELFNEDGSEKELEDTEDKKKALNT